MIVSSLLCILLVIITHRNLSDERDISRNFFLIVSL